jgi:hypothetical protein
MIIKGVRLRNVGRIVGLPGPIMSGLKLWYDLSNSSSYPGGSIIYDLSASGINGTLSNIAFTNPYFSYNGTNSQISVADNAVLEPGSGDWTMEAWFNVSAFGSSRVILGKFDPGGGSQDVSYSIRINGTGGLFAQIGDGSGAFINSTSYQASLSTWIQVIYVWKNVATNSLETYINGTSIGSVTHSLSSILNTPSNLYIGSYNGGEFSQWFNGKIGVVRLYDRALGPLEVLQNFNANRYTYAG